MSGISLSERQLFWWNMPSIRI